LRQSCGWPIAIYSALWNHFLHDSAGGDYFEGSTAVVAFKISAAGLTRIEKRVREYNVNDSLAALLLCEYEDV
jgi:hypothetical protein